MEGNMGATGKKKIIGYLLIFLFAIFGASVSVAAEGTPPPNSETPAPTPIPTPVRTVVGLGVANAPLEVAYKSTVSPDQISLRVQYSDQTTAIVNPDAPFVLDTKKIGMQTVVFSFGGRKVEHILNVVPRQVTGITMKKGTSTSMKISWDKLEEAKTYEIFTSNREDGTFTFLASATDNTYEFKNLVQGEIRYVKIHAAADGFTGPDSETAAIAAKPEKAESLAVTKSESTAMDLCWNEAFGATGYAVYYKLSTKKAYTYAGSTDALKYHVSGLAAGKEYDFAVYSFAADISNQGDASNTATYGTAPAIPVISELKGGDKRMKVYWKTAKAAETYRIFVSDSPEGEFQLAGQVKAGGLRLYPIDNLTQNKMYYLKIEALRDYKGDTLIAVSSVLFVSTKKAEATSTAAKYYGTLSKFKKSPAYKSYKAFQNKVLYNRSYVLPGMKITNNGGFNSKTMVPQSIAFAGSYMLISAYDKADEQESVIYIMDKATRRYITALVLPHKGHVGGMAYDGKNLWITYGKNLQCLKYSVIHEAAKAGGAYTEVYAFTTVIAMPDTASFVTYYKNKIWVGTYNQSSKKYMYGFAITGKAKTPTLKKTNKMLMPNRTQGVAVTSDGKMIVSRSCQTKKGKSGFLCQLDIYKPTWKLSAASVKKNKKKKTVQMPPMNEGIAISGSYTYIVFESPAFTECQAPVDRVAAFKTSKLLPAAKKTKKQK